MAVKVVDDDAAPWTWPNVERDRGVSPSAGQ